eukprot:66360-Amorphochlora_amoeboformis.AAC.1
MGRDYQKAPLDAYKQPMTKGRIFATHNFPRLGFTRGSTAIMKTQACSSGPVNFLGPKIFPIMAIGGCRRPGGGAPVASLSTGLSNPQGYRGPKL